MLSLVSAKYIFQKVKEIPFALQTVSLSTPVYEVIEFLW